MRELYQAPDADMKNFLVATLPLISGLERLEGIPFAKLLTEKWEGKAPFNTNEIADSFSWLYRIGVLDYERAYVASGGWRLYLFRKCGEDSTVELIDGQGDFSPAAYAPKNGCCDSPKIVKSKSTGKRKCKNCGTKIVKKPVKRVEADQVDKLVKKKDCCDNKRVVKSKKTGNRKCKNCGTKYPSKKES